MNQFSCRVLSLGMIFSLAIGFSICSAQEHVGDPGMPPGPPPGMTVMQPTKDISSFRGAYTLDRSKDLLESKTITAEQSDENAVLLKNSAELTLVNAHINKAGDTTSGDGSNFNGQNAAILVAGKSNAVISDSMISSNSEGANAIFATGEQTKITLNNIKIHTSGNSSRGLDATYRGTIVADHVVIKTEGAHCADVATDRGEGTITVDHSILTAAGEGSPCIYSTGNITVNNSMGQATGSECAVIEGKNSIELNHTSLTGNKKHGVMLYQSFSGDANEGIARFTAIASNLTSNADGAMFYVTNTKAETILENTNLNFNGGVLIDVTSDRWGNSGANGGDYTFTGIHQKLAGDIRANELSTIIINLQQTSSLTGAINKAHQAKAVTLKLDSTSNWNVNDDSYVTILTDEDHTLSNIKTNGHTIYYDANELQNSWLDGKTVSCSGGGKIMPFIK